MLQHFDTEAVIACAAPRPMLFMTGDRDPGSPVEGIKSPRGTGFRRSTGSWERPTPLKASSSPTRRTSTFRRNGNGWSDGWDSTSNEPAEETEGMKGSQATRCYAGGNTLKMKTKLNVTLTTLALLTLPLAGFADSQGAAVAISARASSDYTRAQLPNGTYQAETFAFGKGGVWGGAAKDDTIDKLDFIDIAKTIAVPLASQNFVSSHDPKNTRLLIMVYWGTTHAAEHSTSTAASQNLQIASEAAMAANHVQIVRNNPNDSCAPLTVAQSAATGYAIRSPDQIDLDNAMTGAMAAVAAEDHSRELVDAKNASLLGYDVEWDQAVGYKGTALEFRRKELVNELEEGRYFVVLMAYDFQMMWREKKPKLLWEARYSIRDRGNDFEKQLAAMTEQASQYFGRNTGGLVRKELPEGHVEIGEQKVLAYGSQK